jgi:hypothetical protein
MCKLNPVTAVPTYETHVVGVTPRRRHTNGYKTLTQIESAVTSRRRRGEQQYTGGWGASRRIESVHDGDRPGELRYWQRRRSAVTRRERLAAIFDQGRRGPST